MKGVAPNISSTLATGAVPRARMKLTKLPASSTALASNAKACIADVDQHATALQQKQWQH